MEESQASTILAKIGLAILAIALFDLVFLNWWILKKSNSTQGANAPNVNSEMQLNSTQSNAVSPSPISSATPNTPQNTTTQTVVQKETQTIIQTPQKEIFIPLGSGLTNSQDFVNLAGMEVTIDTAKYPPIDSVYFEGAIWVEGGNGRAYLQLRNGLKGYPIAESAISTNSANGLFQSKKITLTNGSHTYVVQAKTDIVNFAAHIDNARIKITLKWVSAL